MNIESYLSERGVRFELISHHDTYDAQHMAESLHVPGRFIAKTVLLRADRGYAYIVAVLPATRMIDLQLASAALGGSQLELATEIEVAQHCPDLECGVLPPFGSECGMKTLVDEELTHDPWIVFEGSNHHEAIRMSSEDYLRLERPLIARFGVAPPLTRKIGPGA